ncbi:MAG: hypothetical protein ACLSHU_12140 [Oscillospiraceae bacterium]
MESAKLAAQAMVKAQAAQDCRRGGRPGSQGGPGEGGRGPEEGGGSRGLHSRGQGSRPEGRPGSQGGKGSR